MLNITNHQRNANQNHNCLTPLRMAVIKKKTTNVVKDVEKRILLYAAGGNVNWCSHCANVWKFLKKLKIQLPHNPVIPLFVIYPKKNKYKFQLNEEKELYLVH